MKKGFAYIPVKNKLLTKTYQIEKKKIGSKQNLCYINVHISTIFYYTYVIVNNYLYFHTLLSVSVHNSNME